MKRLRNIGLYYIILTLVSVLISLLVGLLLFIPLLPICVLGIIFILTYFILKKVYKKEQIQTKLSKPQLEGLNLFLLILPFLFYAVTIWYTERPYKQTIVLPKDYEGVVAIQYNKPNGQSEKWIGGFLGIGSSRLIKVDTTGIAEIQFKFHHNAIPFLGAEQTYYNRGGLKIYYENDLSNEIDYGRFDGVHMEKYLVSKSEMQDLHNIYFTGFDYYPLMIFVVTKPSNYHDYFMTEEEKNELQRKHDENPYKYYGPDKHELNNKFNHYYELDPHYKELKENL